MVAALRLGKIPSQPLMPTSKVSAGCFLRDVSSHLAAWSGNREQMPASHAFAGGLMAAGECNGLLAQWGRATIIAPPATHDGRGCRFESGTGNYLSGGNRSCM